MKRTIRLAFSEFPGRTNIDFLVKLLSRRYHLDLSDERPDYVIYSVFGTRFMGFGDAVRIQFVTENLRADFNLCDYAFSCDWLTFGDRHFRAPNFVIYPQWQDLLARGASNLKDLSLKPDFCNFVYSNGRGHSARTDFFHALNGKMPVESFGAYLRNSPRTISPPYRGDWSQGKVDAQRAFRFSIAFENSSSPGYTTEKIVHALAADTIPIYWGDPLVAQVFNPERFINAQELGFEETIERVLYLNFNEDALLHMLNRPFFSDSANADPLRPETLLEAFSHIFDQPKDAAMRRNLHMWGPIYETRRRREAQLFAHVERCRNVLRGLKRRLGGS